MIDLFGFSRFRRWERLKSMLIWWRLSPFKDLIDDVKEDVLRKKFEASPMSEKNGSVLSALTWLGLCQFLLDSSFVGFNSVQTFLVFTQPVFFSLGLSSVHFFLVCILSTFNWSLLCQFSLGPMFQKNDWVLSWPTKSCPVDQSVVRI